MTSDTLSGYEQKVSPSFFQKHISLATTLVSTLVFLLSFIVPTWKNELRSIGLFALSGALTNWLAIHMLFEKIPGLYGSGIISLKFQEFKKAIYGLFMEEFFSHENLQRFFAQDSQGSLISRALQNFSQEIDYEEIYQKLVASILSSPLGSMLSMFGGPAALEPVKPHLVATIKQTVEDLMEQAGNNDKLKANFGEKFALETIKPKIEKVIKGRLDELTPHMVKEIIRKVIRRHLGWLVLWGGVFGGIIGLFSSFIS